MEISVIIPVYNVEKYIERCIVSLQNQTFKDFEIVIVNDATPDGSMKIVEKYSRDDDRFFVVTHEHNMGLMCARKTGYKNARGKYSVFCDSDDFMPDNALEILHRAITSSGADLVVGNTRYVLDSEEKGVLRNKLSFGADTDSLYKSLLTAELAHSLWAKIFDSKLFRDHDYDTFEKQTNGEDAILLYQVAANVKNVQFIDEVVYNYSLNDGSATKSKMSDAKMRQMVISTDYVANFLENHKPHLSDYLKWRHTKILLSLLLSGMSKRQVKTHFRAIDVNKLSRIRSVFSCYDLGKASYVYLLLNIPFVRRGVCRLLN